jgi:hypothetical protein
MEKFGISRNSSNCAGERNKVEKENKINPTANSDVFKT